MGVGGNLMGLGGRLCVYGCSGEIRGVGDMGGGWVGVSDTRGPHNPLLPVSLRLRTLYRTVKISFVLKMLYFLCVKATGWLGSTSTTSTHRRLLMATV